LEKIKFNLIDLEHLKLEVLNLKLKQKFNIFFGVKLGIQLNEERRND
jgi:hypothetical protein